MLLRPWHTGGADEALPSNATGISNINAELMPKRLGLLHELLPRAVRFGVLVNPDNPSLAESIIAELRRAAVAR